MSSVPSFHYICDAVVSMCVLTGASAGQHIGAEALQAQSFWHCTSILFKHMDDCPALGEVEEVVAVLFARAASEPAPF